MKVSINFPAEIETTLLRRAEAAGKDVATIVKEFVTERLAEDDAPTAKVASHQEFMAKLHEIIDLHESHGVSIANPHVYTVEDGSRHKRVDAADQLGFKHETDPHGLLNPGKMRTFVPKVA